MLKALYDYGVRQNLTQPPGFSGKTVKAYISLSEDDDHVSIYLGDKESVLCPDIGSLAQGRDKCNILVEKRSIVVPDAETEDGKLPAKSRFFLETLRSASEAEPRLKACVRALETPETIEKIREELDRMKIKPGDTVSFRVNAKNAIINLPQRSSPRGKFFYYKKSEWRCKNVRSKKSNYRCNASAYLRDVDCRI